MKIRNFIKILSINILVCIFFVCILEMFCIYNEYRSIQSKGYTLSLHLKSLFKFYKNFDYVNLSDIRPISKPTNDSNKSPIAIMGCSFAYGLGLKNNETLASQLSQRTERTVYNVGVIGSSPREMLYILRNEELRNRLFGNRNDFEYIIYPYISHHLFRLYNQIRIFAPSPCFKKDGDSLKFYQPNKLLMKSKLYQEIIETKYGKINGKESFDLLCLYLKEINREINKHFPNAKFVVFIYEDHRQEDWSLIKKEGIEVIEFTKITGTYLTTRKFVQDYDNRHPNARAWEVAVPIITQELNL